MNFVKHDHGKTTFYNEGKTKAESCENLHQVSQFATLLKKKAFYIENSINCS